MTSCRIDQADDSSARCSRRVLRDSSIFSCDEPPGPFASRRIPATCHARRASWTRLLAILLGFVPVVSTPLAFGQDEAEAEEELLFLDAGFEVAESNFYQWIFGSQTSDHGLKRIESQLSLRVEAIDRVCGLTEAQMAKLHLAGQGDIKRFYDEVSVVHENFMKVRRSRNALNGIWQEIQPLQTSVNAGLFGQASFIQKVLIRSLNHEQSAKYEEFERQQAEFRHNARLGLMVAMMERTIPLRAEQRERFIGVLKEETEPLQATGPYNYYLTLFQLGKVPAEKLRPIFDEAQWKALQPFKANGLAFEMLLKQQKVLP